MAAQDSAATTLRRLLLALFAIGAVGTEGELLLIGHFDGVGQWVPLLLLGASLVVAAWWVATSRPAVLRAFQVAMGALVAGGTLGLWLHYRGNVAFERELSPTRSGFDLFWTAIRGESPPSLAPGTLIHLGLLGLAYAYRHPAFEKGERS